MENSNTVCEPMILSPKIVEMLRGERGYTEDSKEIAELAIDIYQDGKAGFRALEFHGMEGFDPKLVERMNSFLLACWEQGRKDAGEATS